MTQPLRVTTKETMPSISKTLPSCCPSFLFLLPPYPHTCNPQYTAWGRAPRTRQKQPIDAFHSKVNFYFSDQIKERSHHQQTKGQLKVKVKVEAQISVKVRAITKLKTKKLEWGEREKNVISAATFSSPPK